MKSGPSHRRIRTSSVAASLVLFALGVHPTSGQPATVVPATQACTRPPSQTLEEFCTPARFSCPVCTAEAQKSENPFRRIPTFQENYARAFKGDEGAGEIYEGNKCMAGQFRETVLLTTVEPTTPREVCTGVLVAKSVVLTARHCIRDGIGVIDSVVRFGRSWAEANSAASQRTVVDIRPINIPGETALDLILLRLNRDAPAAVRPATLASEETLNANPTLKIVGFGENTSNVNQTCLHTDVAIASYACGKAVMLDGKPPARSPVTLFGCRKGLELVAGYLSDKPSLRPDTCHGDSGGPAFVAAPGAAEPLAKFHRAFVPRTSGPPRYFLAAITRKKVDTFFVPAGETGCGNGGRYTRVLGSVKAKIVAEALRSPWNAVVQVQ